MPTRTIRLRRSARLVAAGAALTLSVGLLATPSLAAPRRDHGDGDRAFPSRHQVEKARAHAAARARDVAAIKAELLLAEQRLEGAATRAEQASEAYNGAMWRLQQAQQRVRAAERGADRARRKVASQRDHIGALVAQSYQSGGDLSNLSAMMSADGPTAVLDRYAAFHSASSSMSADYARFAASDTLARVFEQKAEQAKAAQAKQAAQARSAQRAAAAAANAAQRESDAIAAQKQRLVASLARAQHISVSLARHRQAALEAIARKRAEERARRAAAAAAAKAAAQQAAQQAAQARADARKRQQQSQSGGSGQSGGQGGSAPSPSPAPAPPAPSGGAGAAIAFAKAQLGEPYQWGAAGPGSWDCSGLMMGAWGSAGRSLPHYSVAQYESTTPISVGSLRPGDLVFWSSNGSPSGIHHVAMYIGGGRIIHAPRTGRPVEIDSMYYWIPPNFFSRV